MCIPPCIPGNYVNIVGLVWGVWVGLGVFRSGHCENLTIFGTFRLVKYVHKALVIQDLASNSLET